MNFERCESLRVWRAPAIGLAISILLHGLFWLGLKQMPGPEPKETPAQVITVSLSSAVPAAPAAATPPPPSAAPPAPAPVAAPPKPKPEPKKIEKVRAPKPKPVAKQEPEPEPQQSPRETSVAPPSASPAPSHSESAAPSGAQSTQSAAPAYSGASYSGPGLHNPPTRYPRLALERRWEGSVRLKVEVLPNGAAGQIHILQSSGHDLLDESALEHVKSFWHFEPAHRGAQAVTSWVVIPIEFKIHSKD
jgi:periplasmic protein TonB